MNAIANQRHTGGLEEYAKLKLDLAAIVQGLLHTVEQRKDETAAGDCRRILARLAEDRFNLAMVGQFSRGKSSLMNALLGAEKLPTGILPLTSVITTVAYGESERVRLQREGWTLPQEIRLDQLRDYVTQEGNPGNKQRVTLAEIRLPHEMLRLGVHFIDTPGVASAIRANTQTTRQFLPEIDAAILVTSFESPFAETEIEFLREIREHVRTVFIVVNKQDLVPATERQQVLDAIRGDLRTAFGADFDVFAISARDALSAKQHGSVADLEATGLTALESALARFLGTQKAAELLLRSADRAESVARQQTISMRLFERARAPENAKLFEDRLKAILAGIEEERHAVMQHLFHQLRLEFPKQCRQSVSLWNSDYEALLAAESHKWFLRDEDIFADAFQNFLRDLSQKIFSQWSSRNRHAIDGIFAGLTREAGTALEGLSTRISGVAAEVLGEEIPADGWPSLPIQPAPLTFRAVSVPLEQFQLPFWCELMPRGRPRELAYRHWRKRMPVFIQLYRASAEAVLEHAVDDWVRDLDRQVSAQTESATAQVSNLLHVKSHIQASSDVDGIMERIEQFRAAVRGSSQAHGLEAEMFSGAADARSRRSTERCVICSRLERALWDFMAHAQYELTFGRVRQEQHAIRSGFCPLHTWQYETVSSPQGVCAAYPEVLMRFARRLRSLAEDGRSIESIESAFRSMLPNQSSCEACALLAAEERAAGGRLAREIAKPGGECPPLCSYHLHAVLAANPDLDAAKKLLLEEARAFEELAEEMRNYALKHSAVRHHLVTTAESQASVAGLARLAGSRRIASPWRID